MKTAGRTIASGVAASPTQCTRDTSSPMSRGSLVGGSTRGFVGTIGCVLALSSVPVFGCESRRRVDHSTTAPATMSFAKPRSPSATEVQDAGDRRVPAPTAKSVDKRPQQFVQSHEKVPSADDPAGTLVNGFIVDSLVDVAAAGPAAATARGVVMVNRSNHLWLARLTSTRRSVQPKRTALTALPDTAGPFPLARAPAVRGGVAYWVSRGSLLRQSLQRAGKEAFPEVLTTDARVGTRVAVPQGKASQVRRLPPVAAYIARPTSKAGSLSAKLWREGEGKPIELTADAASATSVALIASPQGLAAISLEGRTGMSSLHWRLLSSGVSHSAEFELGPDRVIWVGGASGPFSEFVPLGLRRGQLDGLMATSRDMTHFGLLDVRLPVADGTPREPEQLQWINYLNGIEPAPLGAVKLCGRSMLLIAQPSARQAHAPQRLLWIERRAKSVSQGVVLARARSFFDISVAVISDGALIVYVADQRTWARTVRCAN